MLANINLSADTTDRSADMCSVNKQDVRGHNDRLHGERLLKCQFFRIGTGDGVQLIFCAPQDGTILFCTDAILHN